MLFRRFWLTATTLGALLYATAAQPHDTWFQALPADGGAPLLALGTGARFPAQESGIGVEYIAQQGCSLRAPAGSADAVPTRATRPTQPMKPLRNVAQALLLRAPAGAQSCWLQLVPLEIELTPDTVPIYLREVRADAALRAAWDHIQQRGLPWKERYTKHARIDFGGTAAEPGPMGKDMGMGMDIVRTAAADGAFAFRVFRDGQPLPGLAVEWVSGQVPLGIWRRSDAQGLVSVPSLPPGRWLVRAIDLRLSTVRPDEWESRFVSLAFEVPVPVPEPAARATPAPR